jgi:hypothetical protein
MNLYKERLYICCNRSRKIMLDLSDYKDQKRDYVSREWSYRLLHWCWTYLFAFVVIYYKDMLFLSVFYAWLLFIDKCLFVSYIMTRTSYNSGDLRVSSSCSSNGYSHIRTSGYLIIHWGEVSRNPLDFT